MLEPDYFAKKRAELGFDRADQLMVVQQWCDQQFPGLVRARQFHRGVLRLVTTSSAVAGELRWRQTEIIALATFEEPVKRLQITIGMLESRPD